MSTTNHNGASRESLTDRHKEAVKGWVPKVRRILEEEFEAQARPAGPEAQRQTYAGRENAPAGRRDANPTTRRSRSSHATASPRAPQSAASTT